MTFAGIYRVLVDELNKKNISHQLWKLCKDWSDWLEKALRVKLERAHHFGCLKFLKFVEERMWLQITSKINTKLRARSISVFILTFSQVSCIYGHFRPVSFQQATCSSWNSQHPHL